MAVFPQFQLLHGTYNGIEVFVLVMQSKGPQGGALVPAPVVNANNPVNFPYAYVVGSGVAGTHTYASPAAALAAATADFNSLVAAKNANAPPEQALLLLPDSPVLGPS